MGSALLKGIALLTMVCDHIGIVVDNNILRSIGRASFILFSFACAEGWSLTKDKDRYLCRILIWAGISQIPYMLFAGDMPVFWLNTTCACAGSLLAIYLFSSFSDIDYISGRILRPILLLGTFLLPMCLYVDAQPYPTPAGLNVLYTMAAACMGMRLMDEGIGDKSSLIMFVCMLLFCGLKCDYSFLGIGLIMLFYKLRDKGRSWQVGMSVIWSLLVYAIGSGSQSYFGGALAGSLLLLLYDRSTGPAPRWYRNMFYWFYPAHMIVLWLWSLSGS